MAESKHTTGPWAPLRLDIGGRSFWIVISEEGRLPEIEENARLIASAPELLTALKTLIGEAGEGLMFTERGKMARAAIAKAEGRSQ